MADQFQEELDRILADAQVQADARLEALDLPSWLRSPDDYEQVSLNGVEFYLAAPIPVTRENKFDPKKARGRDGGNVTHTGILPITGELVLKIWTGSQERRWLELAPQVDPQRVITTRKTVKPAAPAAGAAAGAAAAAAKPTTVVTKTMPMVRVDYPLLGRAAVDQVYITKVTERIDVESNALLVTLQYVKAGAGRGDATASPKKQTDIVLPNAFDKSADVRATKPDPGKETKL